MAAHPRDHLLVLVLLSLRMRRVGQDQQRIHRWDFDRTGIALQQGSVERACFLKELGKNLMDQSEQMEKARHQQRMMPGSFGRVVVGWLGRSTTTLHCTHYALAHRLKVLSLFLFPPHSKVLPL